MGRGWFQLREGLPVVLGPGASERDTLAAERLADVVRARTGLSLAIETHARIDGLGPIVLLAHEDGAGEGYRLSVSETGVRIDAAGEPGLRWAVETLCQLVEASGRIPRVAIRDSPDFPARGVMLDVSRGRVPSEAFLRELVDRMAALKLNLLMLYTEHTFHFRRHPDIGRGASPLDAHAMRRLDAHAAARHVELVPCLQSLGHMHHVLGLPRYRELAESELGWSLCTTDERSDALLGDLYDEYLPNFRSKLFCANCDEPWDLGRGRSEETARRIGRAGLYRRHVGRLQKLARRHGKRTAIWGDVVHAHPDEIGELDRDLLLLDWWYEAEFDFERVKRFADHGIEFWVCPGTSSWNSLFPRIANSEGNIARYADAGRRHGATGLLVTDWGDHGHYNAPGSSWLGYAFAAQEAWSGPVEPAGLDRSFGWALFGDRRGRVARHYRALGAIQDAGERVPNGSLLQWIFFDDVGPARFLVAARRAALERSAKRLDRVRRALGEDREAFGDDAQTFEELRFAADATDFAIRKGLAGIEWLGWRRRPAGLGGRERRRLARRLTRLADEQTTLGRRLRRLWLARSRPGGFEIARGRLSGSVRSLRRAARSLEAGQPPRTSLPEGFEFGPAYAATIARIGG